jgi:hypothetical protein
MYACMCGVLQSNSINCCVCEWRWRSVCVRAPTGDRTGPDLGFVAGSSILPQIVTKLGYRPLVYELLSSYRLLQN